MTGGWCVGADLGVVQDPSCVAVLEPWRAGWALTSMRTWHPDRDMVGVLEYLVRLVEKFAPPLRPSLAIDARGIGRPVAKMAVEGQVGDLFDVYPVLPSASDREHRQRPDGSVWIGKAPTMARLFRMLRDGSIVVADGLPEARDLQRELTQLREVETPTGQRTTWTHASASRLHHDDRVQALGYAAFLAETLRNQGLVNRIRPVRRFRREDSCSTSL